MNFKNPEKLGVEVIKCLLQRGCMYHIPYCGFDKMKTKKLMTNHIINARFYKHPYVRYRSFQNRLSELRGKGDAERMERKRIYRDVIRRSAEVYCRLWINMDQNQKSQNLGDIK